MEKWMPRCRKGESNNGLHECVGASAVPAAWWASTAGTQSPASVPDSRVRTGVSKHGGFGDCSP